MTRLIGLKKELNNVNDMAMLGKVFHVVFNTNTKEFFSTQMIDGSALDKRAVDLGWVDITELCCWYGRKVNYENCRFYALKVLENDRMVMLNIDAFKYSYPDQLINLEIDTTNNEGCDEVLTIGKLTGNDSEKCKEYLYDGKWYDYDNMHMFYFNVVSINDKNYCDSIIEVISECFVGLTDEEK